MGMSASSGIQRLGAVLTRPGEAARERPPTWIRIRARLQRLSLDRRLAAGESPWASAELRWRADQLTSARERRSLAEEIDRLLDDAARPGRRRGAAVPLDRSAVCACDELLRGLADELRHAELVYAHGVALVRQLLRDGGSPLYCADSDGALDRSIRHARAAVLLD
jgi:hypothetical protein